MAATGGGKIRNRRAHIASKPYAKNKQQQIGLISRVTDTVKSIVPSWLQRYFNNEESPDASVALGLEQKCQMTLPPNGNEEGPPPPPPPPLDGRGSPEPSTSNAEPSTSRSSLNFHEFVLSRPPLSRSHLPFASLDAATPALGQSTSLFSQPSTSSAPGPFSTGFSLVKEIKDNLSQHEDDNISTTSGFSSRASDKDVPNSKTASLPQLWSPETDRTNSGHHPSHNSLKKPAFNLSVFGNSSNSSLNSTILNSSRLGDSQFYPGKTTYGGAAAVKSSRTRPGTPYQPPVRRQIKAKPTGAQPCGVTSATARRILQSLERMSSPLADAKRIPSVSSLSTSLDGTNVDVSPLHAKKRRMENPPPVQKLTVPSMMPLSTANRSLSFRPTLTPGGVSQTMDRTPRDIPTRQSIQLPETPGASTSYPLSSTPAVSAVGSGGGKMKRERSTATARPSAKRQDEDDVAPEAPDLPAISLPISSSALPTFTFSSPVPPGSSAPTPALNTLTPVKETDKVMNKEPTVATVTPQSVPFTFSSPIVKATAASPPSFSSTPGFTFSAPVAKLGPSMLNGNPSTAISSSGKPVTTKSAEEFEGPFKPAKTLKQGSVLDLLKDPGFTSSVTPVETPETSLKATLPSSFTATTPSSSGLSDKVVQQRNASPSKPSDNEPSASPLTSLGPTGSTSSTGFGNLFSKPIGTWECDTCMVQNKPEAVKCVACETAKPGTGLKSSLTLPSGFSAVNTVSPAPEPISSGTMGLGDLFKSPEGSWECDTCMVQNKAEDTKCVACTTAKPGASETSTTAPLVTVSTAAPTLPSSNPVFGFGDKFKKPEGAWECDVCLVENKAAEVKCVACQTVKPGAKEEPKAFGSNFDSSSTGLSNSTPFGSSVASGIKFGTTDSKATESSRSGGFKFGGSFPDSSSATGVFKFGTTAGSSSENKDNTTSLGFKFGTSSEGIKFGTLSSEDPKPEQPAAAAFKFGDSGGIVLGTGASSLENNSSKGNFTFGLSKPEEKSSDSTSTSAAVGFTPAPCLEKSDSSAPSTTTVSDSNAGIKESSCDSIFQDISSTIHYDQNRDEYYDEPPSPTFNFGKPTEKNEASPAPSAFIFGASKDAAAPPTTVSVGGFSFGKPPSTEKPAFTFGKPADKNESSAEEAPKPVFSFGQSAADSTAAPKPAFSFMTSTPSTNSTSSTTSTTAPILFGNGSRSSALPAAPSPVPSTFVFGQATASSTDAPQTKAFVFGQTQDSQPAAPSSLNPAPASAQPFIFGASTNAAPAAAPSFNFGATAPPDASSSAPSAAPSPFVFSSAPSAGFGANQTPSFGSSFGSPFPTPSTQPPTFGANTNAAPVFGQTNVPVFGAAAANSTSAGGAFQFGGASAFGASTAASGVFTFGAGSAAPAPSAATPIAPQPGATTSGFNFSQAPSFNIGSNKSFSSPGGQPIAGRRIKTAVRRRK